MSRFLHSCKEAIGGDSCHLCRSILKNHCRPAGPEHPLV